MVQTSAVHSSSPLLSPENVAAAVVDVDQERKQQQQQHQSHNPQIENLHISRALTPSPLQSRHTKGSSSLPNSSTSTVTSPLASSSLVGVAASASASNGREPLRFSPRKRVAALLAGDGIGSVNPSTGLLASGSAINNEQPGAVSVWVPKSSAAVSSHAATHLSSSSKAMNSQIDKPNKHKPARADQQKAMPRNPSIESSVSSVSSASQSYKSGSSLPYRGTPDSAISPPDVGSLVSAAGSAESALLGLWKEKQSASAHNSQLWRLVEKQRAMILGLNKDLERALKDKERYRKKLKEHLSQIPHLPSAAHRVDSALDRETSQSPAMSDNIEDSLQHHANQRSDTPTSSPRQINAESMGTPEREGKNSISTSSNDLSPHSLPPEQKHNDSVTQLEKDFSPTTAHKVSSAKNDGLVPMQSIATQLSSVLPGLSSSSVSPLPNYDTQSDMQKMTVAPLNTKFKSPAVSLTEATPIAETLSPKSAVSEKASGLRKAPPKPLDLSKGAKVSAHLKDRRETNKSRSGTLASEADDILDNEELPNFERGRRKTREEDDMLRESIMMQQEQEQQRSQSKKEKKSKSKSTSKANEEFVPPRSPGFDDNVSPKTILPRRAQHHDSGMVSSPDSEPASIGAMIMGSSSDIGPTSPRRTDVPAPLVSPGLPRSPRPVNNRGSHVPQPRSPRQNLGSPTTGPWPGPTSHTLSPRAPREPIPAPPMSPLALNSPHLARAEGYAVHISPPAPQQQNPQQEQIDVDRSNEQNQESAQRPQTSQKQGNGLLQPTYHTHLGVENTGGNLAGNPDEKEHIFRGFVTEKYPNLLLSPNALPLIEVKVFSSRLRPSRWSFMAPDPQAEDPVFILAVTSRSEGKQLWRLEKAIMALPALDQQIKQTSSFQGKLPERSLFQGHAPAKIDGRRAALNNYFGVLLETPMDEETARIVCEFFSTDVVGAQDSDALSTTAVASKASDSTAAASNANSSKLAKYFKEGFLTKRGKNFGGWKARYFILDGPELRYYETSDGAHLGTIKLQSAQIGKQSQHSSSGNSPSRAKDDDPENQYRHAFLILEPKRKDSRSLVRHVLCAESDEERDSWVESLLHFVDLPTEEHDSNGKETASEGRKGQRSPHRPGPNKIRRERPRDNRDGRFDGRLTPEADKQDISQASGQDDTVLVDAPSYVPASNVSCEETNIGSSQHHQHPTISAPTNGAPIQNAESWGNKTSAPSTHLGMPAQTKEKETKKRSIFGFRGKGSDHLTFQNGHSPPGLHHQQQVGGATGYVTGNGSGNVQARVIFGAPLSEAVAMVHPLLPSGGSGATTGAHLSTYLPAVVYRCLEYLRSKDAASEEGIFRLSGSNVVIRNLRTRFNNEGDVRLLDEDQYYDIHAVASLLKLYLRELPVSILTRELHLDFLRVLGMSTNAYFSALFQPRTLQHLANITRRG